MSWWATILIFATSLVTGCGRTAGPPLVEYRDKPSGFIVQYPSGWAKADTDGSVVRFVPPEAAGAAGDAAEFVAVFTFPATQKLTDPEIRRQVFTLLPVHGVSGLQQDPRTTAETLWYKFEVTGTSGGVEWAAVGIVASSSARFHVAACAKPLPKWRAGQKQCDEVIRTFQPGNLSE